MKNVNPYRNKANYYRLPSMHMKIVYISNRIRRLNTTMVRTVTTVGINLGLPLFYLKESCLI